MSNFLKKIYLNDYHQDNNAKFISFSNYSMPINYKLGVINENLHTRNHAGIFDVSHMGQILIKNLNSNISFLEKYIPLKLSNITTSCTLTRPSRFVSPGLAIKSNK